MPSRSKRQRSTAARNATRARAGARYRDLAAGEARRAELVAVAVAAADRRRRALDSDDGAEAAAATEAMATAAVELSAEGRTSGLAAMLGIAEDELRRLLRRASRSRSGDG